MVAMTQKQALIHARVMLGKTARVDRRRCEQCVNRDGTPSGFCCAGHAKGCPGGIEYCIVGKIALGGMFFEYGKGSTFEVAIADAEHMEHYLVCAVRNRGKCDECERLLGKREAAEKSRQVTIDTHSAEG